MLPTTAMSTVFQKQKLQEEKNTIGIQAEVPLIATNVMTNHEDRTLFNNCHFSEKEQKNTC